MVLTATNRDTERYRVLAHGLLRRMISRTLATCLRQGAIQIDKQGGLRETDLTLVYELLFFQLAEWDSVQRLKVADAEYVPQLVFARMPMSEQGLRGPDHAVEILVTSDRNVLLYALTDALIQDEARRIGGS